MDDRQKFFKYFRMSFSKFENLKQVLHTDDEYTMETEHKNRRKSGCNCKVSL